MLVPTGWFYPDIRKFDSKKPNSVSFDNAFQDLYIFGESDAGKDKFRKFVLRLISDDLVRGDADDWDAGDV